MEIIVGIGDYAVSGHQEDILKTYALASCVGVTFYCPKSGVAAMIHVVLPDHKQINSTVTNPSYFASTGVPMLVNKLERAYGCKRKDLVIRLYGGADSIRHKDLFCIGRKNIFAITHLLSEMELRYTFSGVGGTICRTLEMDVATGNVKVYTQPIKI